MTSRDFISGFLAVTISAVVAGTIHHRRLEPKKTPRDHASVKSARHPIAEMAKALAGKTPTHAGVNCFGTTLAAFGVGPVPRFATDKELASFLGKSCQELAPKDLVKNYDVGVIFDANSLDAAHSFLIVGRGIAFYKDGVEAKTAFKVGPIVPMLDVFRVGFSRERCDEIAAKTMVETGLPCPGVVKRYRCKTGQVPGWSALDKVEEIVFTRVNFKKTINALDRKMILDSLGELASAKSMVVAKSSGDHKEFMRLRVDSLETFFAFYADRAIWGEDTVRSARATLRGVMTELRQ